MHNQDPEEKKYKRSPPARTSRGRENQLINLAFDETEKRLRNGTASSQIITTLLNFASQKYQLELERMKSELKLAEAKITQIEEQKTGRELYEAVISAFKRYQGDDDESEFSEDISGLDQN